MRGGRRLLLAHGANVLAPSGRCNRLQVGPVAVYKTGGGTALHAGAETCDVVNVSLLCAAAGARAQQLILDQMATRQRVSLSRAAMPKRCFPCSRWWERWRSSHGTMKKAGANARMGTPAASAHRGRAAQKGGCAVKGVCTPHEGDVHAVPPSAQLFDAPHLAAVQTLDYQVLKAAASGEWSSVATRLTEDVCELPWLSKSSTTLTTQEVKGRLQPTILRCWSRSSND